MFLPNFPGATFTPGATFILGAMSIPESRVRKQLSKDHRKKLAKEVRSCLSSEDFVSS